MHETVRSTWAPSVAVGAIAVLCAATAAVSGAEWFGVWEVLLLMPLAVAAARGFRKALASAPATLVVVGAVMAGAWMGYDATQAFAYHLPTGYIAVWLLGALVGGAGAATRLIPRAKWAGPAAMTAAACVVVAFHVTVRVTMWARLDRWEALGRLVPLANQ